MSKKNYSASVLKIASLLIIVSLLIFSILFIIWLVKNPFNSEYTWILYPIVVMIFIAVFFGIGGLYYLIKLMHEVEISKQVTHKTLYYLRRVNLQIGRNILVYVVMMPFVYVLSEKDDSPGLLLIGGAVIGLTGLFYLLMNVFYRLFHDALTLQKD